MANDGRGWFFESMRHSLAARGVKTAEKKKPWMGSMARYPYEQKPKPTPTVTKTPLVVGQKPQQKKTEWLWGKWGKKKEDSAKKVIQGAVSGAPVNYGSQTHRVEVVVKGEQPKESRQEEPPPPPPDDEEPPPPDDSPPKSSRKTKFANADEAWEAAQDELAERYGDNNTGVVKDDAEQERQMSRRMGIH